MPRNTKPGGAPTGTCSFLMSRLHIIVAGPSIRQPRPCQPKAPPYLRLPYLDGAGASVYTRYIREGDGGGMPPIALLFYPCRYSCTLVCVRGGGASVSR